VLRTLYTMGLCALMSVAAQAQSFPSRHITIVVPFAAGSGSDTAARIVGESDQRRAVLLLARELEHRSASWCRQAVIEFNTLMARNEQLDCTNLGERASARTRWTAAGARE